MEGVSVVPLTPQTPPQAPTLLFLSLDPGHRPSPEGENGGHLLSGPALREPPASRGPWPGWWQVLLPALTTLRLPARPQLCRGRDPAGGGGVPAAGRPPQRLRGRLQEHRPLHLRGHGHEEGHRLPALRGFPKEVGVQAPSGLVEGRVTCPLEDSCQMVGTRICFLVAHGPQPQPLQE